MSQTNIQFSVASHLMTALAYFYGQPVTSTRLALSMRADPTFVRRALSRLAKAGLVTTTRGKNGACALARAPAKINLLDIYSASEAPQTFAIHQYPINQTCPVSVHIKDAMGGVLEQAQRDFERRLAKVTLANLLADIATRDQAD